MDKLKLHSPDLTAQNIDKLAELFPNCVTETRNEKGELKQAIDFDQLRQELSASIVEGPQERYQLNWPGKREALLTANAPIAKTLRPCREESVDFDTTRNLFIEGDNLDALKLLQETYLNKVKMIYIDPPYNTGSDFIYEDDFSENTNEFLRRSNQKDDEGNRLVANTETNGRFHSEWLSMIYPRLKLARNLLTDDGSIWISIDDGEYANLKQLCNQVFGEENFVGSFIWEKRKTRENRRVFSFNHDYILCYTREQVMFQASRNLLPLTDKARRRYSNSDGDPRGDWQSVALTAQAGHGTPAQFYTITTPSGRKVDPASGNCWRVTEKKLKELIADNRIWFGSEGKNVPRRKVFINEGDSGLTPHTLWRADEVGTTDSAKRKLNELFSSVTVFDTPKPVGLLERIAQISMDRGDLAFDFFAGSAPLAEAIFQLNAKDNGFRRVLLAQIDEPCIEGSEAIRAGYTTIAEISKERIRRTGKKIIEGECHDGWNKDIGFRVLKIDTSNMNNVYYTPDAINQDDLFHQADNIRPDRTPEDLLFQVMLDWGVDLTLPIARESIAGKSVFHVDENALAACFDEGIDEAFVKELATRQPLRAVFRDSGFANDSVKINVEQIFKHLSPRTDIKVI
ncbi:MAG: site-specific DNA-methyltransferase [gamma proteobacterium endosymbiont of Lamellibrachia anaximandri]|nr:site-specific DNA-methyltransferase [gamma proteobacterium endosymbiont of Lamellibrachia anaximandri]MBL3618863.1 site-specific DNA-methyltransferase [gamma proteobacterium endosymbiont of Lamellibrachia anaximandri]